MKKFRNIFIIIILINVLLNIIFLTRYINNNIKNYENEFYKNHIQDKFYNVYKNKNFLIKRNKFYFKNNIYCIKNFETIYRLFNGTMIYNNFEKNLIKNLTIKYKKYIRCDIQIDKFLLQKNIYSKDVFIFTIYLYIKFKDDKNIRFFVNYFSLESDKSLLYFPIIINSYDVLIKNYENYISLFNVFAKEFNHKDYINTEPFFIKDIDVLLTNYSKKNISIILNRIVSQIHLKTIKGSFKVEKKIYKFINTSDI